MSRSTLPRTFPAPPARPWTRLGLCAWLLMQLGGCKAETLPVQDPGHPDTIVSADAAVEVDSGKPAVDAELDTGKPGGCKIDGDCPASTVACSINACVDGACVAKSAPDAAPCDDGNACTTLDKCTNHTCAGAPADCDDQSECTKDSCDKVSGKCGHVNAVALCNDGDPCTLGDRCDGGKCVGDPTGLCECGKDADCPDDKNLCNGKMFCDKSTTAYKCKINPASKVTCPTVDDSDCSKNSCDTKTGKCTQLAVEWTEKKCEDTTCWYYPLTIAKTPPPCSDGNTCTAGDACSKGLCVAGTTVTCDCQKNADCLDDGNLCNGTPYCDLTQDSPKCITNPATKVVCPTGSDTTCLQTVCDIKTGKCAPTPVQQVTEKCETVQGKKECYKIKAEQASTGFVLCDDNNSCTKSEVCTAGVCGGGTTLCACTEDTDCAGYEDGDQCNGTMFCNKASVPPACELNPATVKYCPPGNDTQCLTNACDAKTGKCDLTDARKVKAKCYPKSDGTKQCFTETLGAGETPIASLACNDGDPCTASDVCLDGKCTSTSTGSQCSCSLDSDCAKLDDGDLCNGTLYCDKSGAKPVCAFNPATVVVCPTVDDTQCQRNACDAKTAQCKVLPMEKTKTKCFAIIDAVTQKKAGEQCFVEVALPGDPSPTFKCDDGNPCTANDTCTVGQCQGGINTCPCQKDADCAKEEDGNSCNGTLYCDKTSALHKCIPNPASVVVCPSAFDTVCAKNQCDKKTGKCANVFVSNGQACDDGNPCTPFDSCVGGECQSGTNTCVCEVDGDCANKEDGNACNGKLYCAKTTPHQCLVNPATVVVCPSGDDSACMKNTCDIATGACKAVAVKGFVPCEDDNPCTQGDLCAGGVCTPGNNLCGCQSNPDCASKDDENLCNGKLICDTSSAPFRCVTNPGSWVECTGSGACVVGQCDAATGKCSTVDKPALCNDGNPCTIDSCDAAGGACSHATANDGTPCGSGKFCKAKACLVPQ